MAFQKIRHGSRVPWGMEQPSIHPSTCPARQRNNTPLVCGPVSLLGIPFTVNQTWILQGPNFSPN
ncbi:unnamed protein product [Fusarium venenatum]|uniref:Uncharacterized protein n=1 Tax=Fusarium venenatum TaxID=56646 RepID=A0A2L2U2B3_9HYPO|nr:uncharacterized protein FVRRES_08572 [Fusarium venenatum]CEI68495.1 unnamed protein product [Fusarium venenatum]